MVYISFVFIKNKIINRGYASQYKRKMNKNIIKICDDLAIKPELYCKNNKVINAAVIIVVGHSSITTLYAAKLYHQIKDEYGAEPIIICTATKSLLRDTHNHFYDGISLIVDIYKVLNVPIEDTIFMQRTSSAKKEIDFISKLIKSQVPIIWVVKDYILSEIKEEQEKKKNLNDSYYCLVDSDVNIRDKFSDEPKISKAISLFERHIRI